MQLTDTYQAAVLALLRAEIAAGQRVRLQIVSQSMLPLLRQGDSIWLEQIAAPNLTPGMIITFVSGERLITHRLIALTDRYCQTRGDNCVEYDPPVAYSVVLGRVVAVQRGAHTIDCRSPRWWLVSRLLGWLGGLQARAVQAVDAATSSLPVLLALRPARAIRGILRIPARIVVSIALADTVR